MGQQSPIPNERLMDDFEAIVILLRANRHSNEPGIYEALQDAIDTISSCEVHQRSTALPTPHYFFTKGWFNQSKEDSLCGSLIFNQQAVEQCVCSPSKSLAGRPYFAVSGPCNP